VRITTTAIEGPAIVDLDIVEDDRGFFARTFDRAAFAEAGLSPVVEQCSMSYNRTAGTLRGMHLQLPPHEETKLVRVVRGAILDIVVDLRPGSPTRFQHVAVELNEKNRRALFVPSYFAHGFQTLVDDTEVVYQISGAYAPTAERSLRYDDPRLGLSWPLPVSAISAKDSAVPLLSDRSLSEFDPLVQSTP
jgi:dTDP-4-dehydrorhamnose 3,5-epimerase